MHAQLTPVNTFLVLPAILLLLAYSASTVQVHTHKLSAAHLRGDVIGVGVGVAYESNHLRE